MSEHQRRALVRLLSHEVFRCSDREDAGRIARIVLFATAASFVSFSAAVALLI